MTRDFSTSGVYFETDQSFSLAETIEFSMILEHTALGAKVRLQCLGEIVRVEPTKEKTGVAVDIQSYRLEGLQNNHKES